MPYQLRFHSESVLQFVALAAALLSIASCSANRSSDRQPVNDKHEASIPTLHVSAQQKTNADRFLSWMESHPTLKAKTRMHAAYRKSLEAIRGLDYAQYEPTVSECQHEYDALNADEKGSIMNFLLALSPDPAADEASVVGANSASASGPFGTCTITCPNGFKPVSSAAGLLPLCGCEPSN